MSPAHTVSALIWLGVGAAIAIGSYRLGIGSPSNPGAGLFPFVIGVSIVVLSTSVSISALRMRIAKATAGVEGARLLPVIAVSAALGFYTLALERIGFGITTFVFLAVLLAVLGDRGWPQAAVASACITAGSYAIFAKLLKITLPAGPIGF
jgi:putative tricarboxylic transport membrane protein